MTGLVFRRRTETAFGLGVILLAWGALGAARRQQPVSSASAARFADGGNAAEVPMELAANAVFVPVRAGGARPWNWLLDTASTGSAADPQAIESGAEGGAVTLTLPGVDLLEPNLALQSFQALGPWYGLRVGGVVGDDLLAHLVAELDYSRLSIELYDPGAYRQPSHMEKLPIRWIEGLPTIRARLRVGGQTIDGDFVLNTGASSGVVVFRSFLAAQRLSSLQGKTIPGETIDVSGAQDAALLRGESIEFGSMQVSQPIVAVSGSPDAPSATGTDKRESKAVAGWIGGEILRKLRMVLDFPANCVYLAANRDFVFPIEADASGATITAAGADFDEYEVRNVREGSPAAQAGLEPGDQIVLIDGEATSDLSLDEIRDLLRQAGHSPVLVVERLGKRVRIELHLQPIL